MWTDWNAELRRHQYDCQIFVDSGQPAAIDLTNIDGLRLRRLEAKVDLLLRQFGLELKAPVLAGGISQGERKLLDVAIAYALKPRLLFLDEPTSGVSTREKAPIMDIVSAIVRAGGITVVIIEHDMDIVFRYSERIVVMHQGTVLADGTPDQIRANDAVTTTLIGTHPGGEPAFGSSGNA